MARLGKIKIPDKRIHTPYIDALNISAYGEDNCYPQMIDRLVKASNTAGVCIEKYQKSIYGRGFADKRLANLVVNNNGDTANAVLLAMSRDLAEYGGVTVHVNYNVAAQKTSLRHVPLKECRISEQDNRGFSAFIVRHPDWAGEITQNGKTLSISDDTVERFHVFKDSKKIVQSEMLDAGGVDNFKGQILYTGIGGNNIYPISKTDRIRNEMATDEGLSKVSERNVNNNFFPNGFLVMRKSAQVNGNQPMAPGATPADRQKAEMDRRAEQTKQMDELEKNILEVQGAENLGKLAVLWLNRGEEVPEMLDFGTKNFDKDFTVTDSRTVDRIYATFEQEPFYLIRKGGLGFSSQFVKDAYEYSANQTFNERQFLEMTFARLLKNSVFEGQFDDMEAHIIPPMYMTTDLPMDQQQEPTI